MHIVFLFAVIATFQIVSYRSSTSDSSVNESVQKSIRL